MTQHHDDSLKIQTGQPALSCLLRAGLETVYRVIKLSQSWGKIIPLLEDRQMA